MGIPRSLIPDIVAGRGIRTLARGLFTCRSLLSWAIGAEGEGSPPLT